MTSVSDTNFVFVRLQKSIADVNFVTVVRRTPRRSIKNPVSLLLAGFFFILLCFPRSASKGLQPLRSVKKNNKAPRDVLIFFSHPRCPSDKSNGRARNIHAPLSAKARSNRYKLLTAHHHDDIITPWGNSVKAV